MTRRPLALLLAGLLVVAALVPSGADAEAPPLVDLTSVTPAAASVAEVERIVAEEGTVRIVVGLRATYRPEGDLGRSAARAQRSRIERAADGLALDLVDEDDDPGARPAATDAPVPQLIGTLPFVALEVDADELERLLASPYVATIEPDLEFTPAIDQSVPLVGAPAFWDAGLIGAGWAVAVLDTGVDTSHVLLGGRVVAEACFSTDAGTRETLCPNGEPVQIGTGAAEPCDVTRTECGHGTHVAGVVAAEHATYKGMARGASIIGVQVFHLAPCPNDASVQCLIGSLSDILAALDHVATLADTIDVAAVNLSLGGGEFSSACDASLPALAASVATLRSKGVGVIAASGNGGLVGQISAPACLSGVVSVGSTTKSDVMSSFSNAHPTLLDLVAPGSSIRSAFPGNLIATFSGTSFATPHVAGAWALLREGYPDATPDELLAMLKESGVSVTDTRTGATGTYPRLAIAGLVPPTTGFLRVATVPAVVSSIRANGVLRTDWGIDWVTVDVGDYEVCFGDVPGFATPACETVQVAGGRTGVVEGAFTRLGLLKVDVLPVGLPSTVFVDGEWRDEYGSFLYLEPDTYTVCWGDVPDHQAPDCQQATVVAGQTTTVVGTFTPTGTPTPGPAPDLGAFGYLRATTDPAVASRISVDGVVRGDWGLTWVKVPVGDHEVCFSGVPGFATPACRTVTVVEGETTTTVGAFTRLGLLRVDVEPSLEIDVLVDGVPRNQYGLFVFMPAGTYQVCGTAAPGWTTPACRNVTVTAGQQRQTTLTYVAS